MSKDIPVNPMDLYHGCLFAAVIHAILVGEYPELSYEHSWDGFNYSLNNSQGCRGTVTFHPQYIVAVFQDIARIIPGKSAYDCLHGMPEDILRIAESEALQYVLVDSGGEIKPVITAAFWGTWEELTGCQRWSDILENGGYILENQLLPHRQSLLQWDDYYGMTSGQMELAESLFARKIAHAEEAIFLTPKETENLYGDFAECAVALQELDIYLPPHCQLSQGRPQDI